MRCTRVMPRLAGLSVDARVLAFAIALAVLTTLVVGVYPAFRLATRDAGVVLRDGRTIALGMRATVWRALIGFEVALAMVLLTGSAMLIETFHHILTSDTGFDSHGILTVSATNVSPSHLPIESPIHSGPTSLSCGRPSV